MNDIHQKSLYSKTNKVELYNKWANTYDEYVRSHNYVGPRELIKNLIRLIRTFPVNNNSQYRRELEGIKILDFGCGTGLVGEELRKTNLICSLHGIDISLNMINKALEKNFYNRIFNLDITKDNLPYNILYDYIISSGVFVEGHVSFNVIPRLLKYLKSGGLLMLTVRDSYRNQNILDFNRNIVNNDNIMLIRIQKIDYLDMVDCKLVIARKLV